MRIILKENAGGCYYRPGGSWTSEAKEAMDFGSIQEATLFAQAHGFKDFSVEKRASFFQDLAKRIRVYFAYFG